MSITAQFIRISENECQDLISDSGEKLEALLNESAKPLDKDELSLICWKYSKSGINGWKSVEKMAEKLELSETELKNEIKKRGMHMRLDLDKLWDEMHKLLNGVSLHEEVKNGPGQISSNKPTDTKRTSALADELNKEIGKIDGSLRQQIKDYTQLAEASGKNPLENPRIPLFMVSKLQASIAALLENYDEGDDKKFTNDLRSLLKLVDFAHGKTKDIILKMKDGKWDEAEKASQSVLAFGTQFQELFPKLFAELSNKQRKTSQNPWVKKKQKDESPFSIAVTGGDTISNWEGGYGPARYLSPKQVKEIVRLLQATTYKKLASKHKLDIDGFEKYFDEFGNFYYEAAKNKEAIICVFT